MLQVSHGIVNESENYLIDSHDVGPVNSKMLTTDLHKIPRERMEIK